MTFVENTADRDYLKFVEYVYCTDFLSKQYLYEGIIPEQVKQAIEFIKKLGKDLGYKIKDVVKVFLDKNVFNFFKGLKWDFKSLIELVKRGYSLFSDLLSLIPNIIHEVFKDSKAIAWTTDNIKKLEDYIKKHPKLKIIFGIGFGALLFVIWLNMSFTGDFINDFDFSDILLAVTGQLSFHKFITSKEGIKTLTLLFTGTLLKFSFSWWSTPLNIVIGIITTVAKQLKIKLSKGKNNNSDYELVT